MFVYKQDIYILTNITHAINIRIYQITDCNYINYINGLNTIETHLACFFLYVITYAFRGIADKSISEVIAEWVFSHIIRLTRNVKAGFTTVKAFESQIQNGYRGYNNNIVSSKLLILQSG